MGNVCNCKQLGLTKDMTSDVEVEQTIIKKKSANELKMIINRYYRIKSFNLSINHYWKMLQSILLTCR